MRTFRWTVCLLIQTIALPAQSGPQPADPGVPAILRDYFGLTSPQISQIVGINAGLESLTGVKNQEIAGSQAQYDAELQKPVLNAAALGALAVVLEQARRDVRAAQAQALTNIVKVLSPEQRLKLQALQDARDLQPVIDAGVSFHFLQEGGNRSIIMPMGVFRKPPERLPTILRDRR